MKQYLNERGFRILKALDAVAARHAATPAQVSLAWLIAQPNVTPIASATSLTQLADILKAPRMVLSGDDLAELNKASA
jgi:aryl-alcohol dehydrogenase-like predicted oxidoreductase